MFKTDNLHNEALLSTKRRRLYGDPPLVGQTIDYTVFSPSKGTLYIMCGVRKIFKVYPRLNTKPHTVLTSCIVGIKGSEHLRKSQVRAIDVIAHIAEESDTELRAYSQLVIHTKSGQCFILCEDPPGLKAGHATLQIEDADRYPPDDAMPVDDFQLRLPAQRAENE